MISENQQQIEHLCKQIIACSEKLKFTVENSMEMYKGQMPDAFHIPQLETINDLIAVYIQDLKGSIDKDS